MARPKKHPREEQFMQIVGRLIARHRKAKGLSQTELGRRCGRSHQAVHSWENGVSPTIYMMVRIGGQLDISFWMILKEAMGVDARLMDMAEKKSLTVEEQRIARIEAARQIFASNARAIRRRGAAGESLT